LPKEGTYARDSLHDALPGSDVTGGYRVEVDANDRQRDRSAVGCGSRSPVFGWRLAFLESALRITGPDSFQEDGTIAFGDDSEHLLRFSTLGHGYFERSVEPGILAGTASWKVDGGQGQFAAASGYISSTFTVSESGELNDVHCGLIFLPD